MCVYMHAHVSHALYNARAHFAMKEDYVFEKVFIGARGALRAQQGSGVRHLCRSREDREE